MIKQNKMQQFSTKRSINMTSISAEQQEFRGKLVAFGLLLTNVNRVYNESITETMDSVMI